MGTEIKRNKKGQSQLNSSITDELLHDKRWISAEEAKLIIIYRAYYDFCIRVIEIDGNFPADFKGVSELFISVETRTVLSSYHLCMIIIYPMR